ncbi:1-deoxy-D-xylulose-5-phosphate reductoisomerase [Candidatus Epulonipiscium fishelsonii]|uniref:1-deoxy-D-xylulose-5-phosphate reductoisomerase n=1 Tax=Candidatus Epulonipiscium fishelsonii TaxID=77094 RepID=A0ACC8XDI3_9FIRM|nr:1-deoxy-D-xylulose-5-phosphate reductoisomerase [Epulopiscium sp. SCG-B05WGA-EpuloA1]ONI41016.1 1-deoxy-D-xylulose-5-phosphate reductoisomerase [Epulopiscium sp. SCG-B11WGA-EpuloA1]ONI47408.1 1-deoxy-D-xylulose-5-phosphate reductoisomerase [Epulopiscium sp. SCG-C06WGA-EpuloA1]
MIILGSTGSIGTQALDCIRKEKNTHVYGLSTNTQIDLLEEQIKEFKPVAVCVVNEEKAVALKNKMKQQNIKIEIYAGAEGLIKLVKINQAHIVLNSIVGMAGLLPTIEAIKSGKDIALANKETLVVAGEVVMNLAKEYNKRIVPIDSEHAAIWQCLGGPYDVNKLILTASGGPFRDFTTKEQLENVTLEQALKHPNWAMGKKITIDSATLMNKGLEVIEAHHLFNVAPQNIEVVVHHESIIHSMVEYKNGSVIAQLAMPDMRQPILYAIDALNYHTKDEYRNKECNYIERLDWKKIKRLTFDTPKIDLFPCLGFAYNALEKGGTMPAVLNASNEEAVAAFLEKKISFIEISEIIHQVMKAHICISKPSLNKILDIDRWARDYTLKIIEQKVGI